jgi:hypothetical protein
MRDRVDRSSLRLIAILAGFVAVSAAYVGGVNVLVSHPTLKVESGWNDTAFKGPWLPSSSSGISGKVSVANGTLTVTASGTVSPGGIAAGQDFNLPSVDLSKYPYLTVQVLSSSVYVAVRIDAWPNANQSYALVMSTFNDHAWHTIDVDLNFLGLSGVTRLHLLELGWMIVQQPVGPGPSVEFRDLALVNFVAG